MRARGRGRGRHARLEAHDVTAAAGIRRAGVRLIYRGGVRLQPDLSVERIPIRLVERDGERRCADALGFNQR